MMIKSNLAAAGVAVIFYRDMAAASSVWLAVPFPVK